MSVLVATLSSAAGAGERQAVGLTQTMRLVTWNCKGGFSRKHAATTALKPDVLVLPEAERLDSLSNVIGSSPIRSHEWVGSSRNKGLGVIAYGDYSLSVHEAYDPRHRWILPLSVAGPEPFTLFAVWTVPHEETGYYVSCLLEALETYRDLLADERVVWAGDFNQSTLFDSPSNPLHFSHWLAKAKACGFDSLYHLKAECAHGAEPAKTFFLHHNEAKPHHIDYIFAKPSVYAGGFELTVGDHAAWYKLSDHMPLTLTTSVRPALSNSA